jgi:oxygen-independent coproporphyrinogen-3 oxidase
MYWNLTSTWGFGLSAASFTHGIRMSRPKQMASYATWIDTLGIKGYQTMLYETQIENGIQDVALDTLLEKIMLSLRTSDGLDVRHVDMFGGQEAIVKVMRALEPYQQVGKVKFVLEEGSITRISLTDPDGFLISNDVISSVFANLS